MIQERYRVDYPGEYVITDTKWTSSQKFQTREWIDNPIENQHISGRAAVIGSSVTRDGFNLKLLENHIGGLLGSKKLQTYGSNDVWKEMRCDFCVENTTSGLERIILDNLTRNTVFYTSTKNVLAYPGKFYVVPYAIKLLSQAQAAYIAAFDGHKEIFLLGCEGENDAGVADPQIASDLNQVVCAYPSVTFYFVTDAKPPADILRRNSNVQTMTYREFVVHCDI